MLVIYNCYGGTHSSVIASAIHLKALPTERIPSKQEILGLQYFNKLKYKDMGRLIYHGADESGNKIFTIGRGTSRALIPSMQNLTREFYRLYNINDSFIFVNTSPIVPLSMTLGGFFSRGLKIHFIGVPLLAIGARSGYNKAILLVKKTKEICNQYNLRNVIINIDKNGEITVHELN